jgi:hypothetical protein
MFPSWRILLRTLIPLARTLTFAVAVCGAGFVRAQTAATPTPPAAAPAPTPPSSDQAAVAVPNGLRNAAFVLAPSDGNGTTDGDSGKGTAKTAAASLIAIGTLYGLAIPLYKPEFFKVTNGTLERVRDSTASDYIQPAVYVLPSIAILTNTWAYRKPKATQAVLEKQINHVPLTSGDYNYGVGGSTLSFIIPAGLTSTTVNGVAVSAGLGLAYGRNIGSAEVGIAAAVVWNQTPYLSNSQQGAIGTAVGGTTGISDQIDSRLRPSVALGLFLTPTF